MLQKFKLWWAKNYRYAIIFFAIKTIIKVGIVLLVFNRCKPDSDVTPIDLGQDYFPAEVGHYITYELDSITYDDFFTPVKVDSSFWEVKELFASEFIDGLGRSSIRVERYMRPLDSLNWQLSDVWYVTKTNTVVEKVEENQRYLKLTFPAKTGRSWFGNQYIETVDELEYLSNWEYNIISAGETETIEGDTYDDVLTVSQQDEETAISKIYAVEKYARNIGMVYKELWVLASQTGIGDPWPGRTEQGFIIRQRITGHGQE